MKEENEIRMNALCRYNNNKNKTKRNEKRSKILIYYRTISSLYPYVLIYLFLSHSLDFFLNFISYIIMINNIL